MTEETCVMDITDKMVEAFGRAWGTTPAGSPGDRRRAGLAAALGVEQFVIWTRYARPTGAVVRHVYGPYPTRVKAQTEVRRMKRQQLDWYGSLDGVEVVVTKLLTP